MERFDLQEYTYPMRKAHVVFGAVVVVFQVSSLVTGHVNAATWIQLVMGLSWVGIGVWGPRINQCYICVGESGLQWLVNRPWQKSASWDEVKQIHLGKMRCEIETNQGMVKLNFGGFSYEVNRTVKLALYDALRREAGAHNVALVDDATFETEAEPAEAEAGG